MTNVCDDNRFELIKKYKQALIESTNIEMSPDEMAVIDNILFRFWQMGWLGKLERPTIEPEYEWIPVTKEQILQAGYEGQEVRFHIDGRLFAIRELAQ